MHIAFLGSEGVPYPAAFARYTEEVGWRLVQRGHKVLVYCRARHVSDNQRYRGMERVVLPSLNTKHLDTITHTFVSTLDVMRRVVDIVHYHGIGPSAWALLPRLRGMKSIVQFHALDWRRDKWGAFAKGYLRSSEYFSLYFPNATVVVSRTLQRYCRDKFGKEVWYAPPGIDSYEPRQAGIIGDLGLEGRDYILFLGRLVPEKGCHHLIRAFEGLHTRKKLVVAGGPDRSEEYANSLKQAVDDRVLFVGHVSGLLWQELFSNAYLYVHPSEMEGLSAALLQAMAFGNCVVASDIPENVEAVANCGYCFKNRDHEDLRRVLKMLLEDPALVERTGRQALRRVRGHYDWETVTDTLERLYLSVLGQLPDARSTR